MCSPTTTLFSPFYNHTHQNQNSHIDAFCGGIFTEPEDKNKTGSGSVFGGGRSPLSALPSNALCMRATDQRTPPSQRHQTLFSYMPPSPPATPTPHTFRAHKSKMMQQIEEQRGLATAHPMVKSTEQRTRERRDGFLRGVRDKQDSRRWNIRSEQILHDDYITQRQAWEEQIARSAPPPPPVEGEYEEEGGQEEEKDRRFNDTEPRLSPVHQMVEDAHIDTGSNLGPTPQGHLQSWNGIEDEVDKHLAAEAQALEALVALHEATQQQQQQQQQPLPMNESDDLELSDEGFWNDLEDFVPASSPRYGSEDEGFEEWLVRVARDGDHTGNDDAMDIS